MLPLTGYMQNKMHIIVYDHMPVGAVFIAMGVGQIGAHRTNKKDSELTIFANMHLANVD